MTATKSKKTDSKYTSGRVEKAAWQGYVSWNMDRIDKKLYKEWANERDVFRNEVPTIVDSGYKLSLSYDARNQACIGSLYCHDAASANAGWCLTARATDPYEALLRVLYVHYVCFEQIWPGEFDPIEDSWQ